MEIRRKTQRRPGADGYKYNSISEFVLTHGREYQYEPPLASYGVGVPQACYYNAYQLAEKRGLVYVEGYALGIIPTLHAWCVEPGSDRVIDVTWRHDNCHAYLGAPFRWDYVRRHMEERGHDCIALLDDWEVGWPLLQAATTGWEYDEAEAALRRKKVLAKRKRK